MLNTRSACFTLVLLTCFSGTVLAHHGVTGLYDTSRPIALTGTVTEATFSPPHPVISIRIEQADAPGGDLGRPDEITGPIATRAEDVGRVREIEFSPVRTFYNLGRRVQVGDKVTVVALRNCRPPHQLRSSWIRLPGGEIVSYAAGLHKRTDGCRPRQS
jgi:hypothetical protein